MSWMYGVWSIRCAKVDENRLLVLATVQLLCSWFPMATSHLWLPTAAWFVYTWARWVVSTIPLPGCWRLILISISSELLWNVSLEVPFFHSPLHRAQDYPATFSPSKFQVWSAAGPHEQQQYWQFVLTFLHLVWETDGLWKISCGEGQ